MLIYYLILILYFSKEFWEKAFLTDVYPIIACLLFLIICSGFDKFIRYKSSILFIFVIIISFLYTSLISGRVNNNFGNVIFIYLIQPVAILCFFSSESESKQLKRIFLASYAICSLSIPLFIGSVYFFLVHVSNFPDPSEIFSVEYTTAGGEVVLRNASFMGASLLLCGVSLVQFLLSQYIWQLRGEYSYLIFSSLSLLNIGLSLSRRALLPVIIFYFVLILLNPKRNAIRVLLFFSCLFAIITVYDPTLLTLFLKKIASIFDTVTDPSNASRITLMLAGLEDILLRPWGLGFGSLSSIGYSQEEVWKFKDIRVTESTLISFVGELGIPSSIILGFLLINYALKLRLRIFLLFVFPLIIESIVGMGLYAPSVSFVSISMIIIIYNLERFTFKQQLGSDKLKCVRG